MEEVNLKFLLLCYDIRIDVEKQSVGVYNRQRDPEAGCPEEPHSAYATALPRVGQTTETLPKLVKGQNHSDNRVCGPIISQGTGIEAEIYFKK